MNLSSRNFLVLFSLFVTTAGRAQRFSSEEVGRWTRQSRSVTIIRDNWGIPHVYGHTNADAVFGLMYAQCEDDFARIEMNYIEKLGRLAEVQGPDRIYDDLLIRMVIDSAEAISDYRKSPSWLKALLNAFADGVNFYLSTHPDVHPALLQRFQPWYPLLWTDGSIGAINTAGLTSADLKACYGSDADRNEATTSEYRVETTGSNGFALAPSRTASGNAILYINPHVTYYFRPEVHMVSDEGLNVYGAVTWGQFFIYQGFNEHCGWMHTSNQVDVADIYKEKVIESKSGISYVYDGKEKMIGKKTIIITYNGPSGKGSKTFQTYFTGHGPIMARRHGEWWSMKAVNRSTTGIIQSWQRTLARSFREFKQAMSLRSNMSNNTVYADAEKNIGYWHGNFVPRRDTSIDWSHPVDGSTSKTEWKGLHSADETIQVFNPSSGWIQNCNSTPFTSAGESSPKKSSYPVYMAPEGENFRAINAARLLDAAHGIDLSGMTRLGYNAHLSAFDVLLPALSRAIDQRAGAHPINDTVLEAARLLRGWNHDASDTSIATALAVAWGEEISRIMYAHVDFSNPFDEVKYTSRFCDTAQAEVLTDALKEALSALTETYGTWTKPWGDINRFQRVGQFPNEKYDDEAPSLAVGRTGSQWGCIPAFESKSFPGTKKRYGYSGNSFMCAVDFGQRISAVSLLTGGESGDPMSKHFTDQQEMFVSGKFRKVLFYKEDVLQHAEKTYHPGLDAMR